MRIGDIEQSSTILTVSEANFTILSMTQFRKDGYKMEYRQVGRSGLRVSAMGLGSWLTFGSSVTEADSIRTIRTGYELGINFFDTANAYSEGRAEEVVGEALAEFPRSSYVVATKVYFPMGNGPNDRGLSRKHIIEQCHASLRRLGTDYIDLYQCHRFDPTVPVGETMRALEDLTTQGKILYAGVSEWTAPQIEEALDIGWELGMHPLISDQPRYNMFQRGIEDEIVPLCGREGLGLLIFSPLAQGFLTGKYQAGRPAPEGSRATTEEGKGFIQRFITDENLRKVEMLKELADGAGIPLAHLAIAWTLRLSEVSSAITGASRPAQIIDNVKAVELKLTPDIVDAIDQILAS